MLSKHEGAVYFPTTLRYSCFDGYSIDGSLADAKKKFQVNCKPTGVMAPYSCQKISCGTPYVLPFTKLTSPSSPQSSLEFEEEAAYKCKHGYTIGAKPDGATEFKVSCQANGQLTDPKVCEPIFCGKAPRFPKARADIAGFLTYGMEATYECDWGYTFDGMVSGKTMFTRKCLIDATFSPVPEGIECKPVKLGQAPRIPGAYLTEFNGKSVSSSTDPDSITAYYPQSIEYRCKSGKSTTGSNSGARKFMAKVTPWAAWYPALPSSCKDITYSIYGQVQDARNGMGVSNIEVSAQCVGNMLLQANDTDAEEIDDAAASNATTGALATAHTSGGNFVIHGLKPCRYRLVYRGGGYISLSRTLNVYNDVGWGQGADVAVSPQLAGDQWRATVKWGETPRDLDTHVNWGWTHVFWAGRQQSAWSMAGRLEQDKTAGYGPETVFLSGVGHCWLWSYFCDITYKMYDYGRNGRIQTSGAQVTLYTGSRVAGTWKVTDCPRSVSGDKNWWHVFTIDGRTNRLKWHCKQSGFFMQIPHNASSKVPPGGWDYESYVGPFPGKYFRHTLHKHHKNNTHVWGGAGNHTHFPLAGNSLKLAKNQAPPADDSQMEYVGEDGQKAAAASYIQIGNGKKLRLKSAPKL